MLDQLGGLLFGGQKSAGDMMSQEQRDILAKLSGAGNLLGSYNATVGAAAPIAASNLINILMGQGRTDPSRLQAEQRAIGQGTQSNQQMVQGALAQRGMQNSGLGQALNAAIGQGGVMQQANARARESAMAEDRRRSDLGLFLNLALNPALNQTGMSLDQYTQANQMAAQQNAAQTAAMGEIIGGALGAIP